MGERIVVMDGAIGTTIHEKKLDDSAFRGVAAHRHPARHPGF